MKPYQVKTWLRHQRRQALHEFHRGEDDVRCAVAPPCIEFENCVAFAIDAQTLIGDRRARDVTGKLFYPFALRRRQSSGNAGAPADTVTFVQDGGARSAAGAGR